MALFFISICFVGCSTTDTTPVSKPSLVVADANNSRVLIYATPTTSTSTASVVLGQTSFTQSQSSDGRGGPSAKTLDNPSSVAMDSSGNLYVADGNDRVLQFRPPFTTGMSASLVIGKPDFTSSQGLKVTASGMGTPSSVAIDSKGDLWVGDGSLERVTEYVPPFSNGMAATVVIGQPSPEAFRACTTDQVPTARTICSPEGITFDSAGDLWVADPSSDRMLEFTPPFSTGMASTLQLGAPQTLPSLSYVGSPASNTTQAPISLAFDSTGNLWLADWIFNRVVEYAPPFTQNMQATVVLGQVDFTHADANQGGNDPTANTLSGPQALSFDGSGNLSVSDAGNNRILIFAPPFSTGMRAATVIGQPTFSTGQSNRGNGSDSPAANTLDHSLGLLAH
ncbi:NHL repeat-containing protein [Tunturibacter empetritectus]|uniref:NHL repeat-containing protein n=1 Tax=Tunturiibacter empetritectus TaxID=3069691 RepID=A0AAU7ZCC2_9BACT